MTDESFEAMLTGGHPNSLGRTVEVVDLVLADRSKLEELYGCYGSDNEVVRLRTSNALKRISREQPQWLVPYIDRLIQQVSAIDQASAQWTLADLFETLAAEMTPEQRQQAGDILKHNLQTHEDWIVLKNTMQTLACWAADDPELKAWLVPQLKRLSGDERKSVAGRAKNLTRALT